MIRLLHFILLTSMLFAATINTSVLGTMSCHTQASEHASEHLSHSGGPHDYSQKLLAGTCFDCFCCDYEAHLIPLPSAAIFTTSITPKTKYIRTEVAYFSVLIPPLTHPPNA